MTTSDIAGRWLFNQRIVQSTIEQPGQVVSWFAAMQAQDWPGVKWAVGLRCADVDAIEYMPKVVFESGKMYMVYLPIS